MTKDGMAGYLSAVRCVQTEAKAWSRNAEKENDRAARAVMVAVASALNDTASRMTLVVLKEGLVSPEEILST